MTNVHEILVTARAAGQQLSDKEAAVLFAAAVRLASAQGATLRGRLVEIDEAGALHLAPFDDQAPEEEMGYLAPELLAKDAPRKSEPRVQVYAAGALGYELLTGKELAEAGKVTGSELSGPLGDIIRMALAPDRRERFGDLTQLYDAVEGVQRPLPTEKEKQQFAAIRARAARWASAGMEKEALAKVIEKLTHLDAQLALSGKAWTRIDTTQRQSLERLDRFESGLQRVEEQARQRPSLALPAIALGLLGAAIGAAAVVFVPVPSRQKTAAEEKPSPPVAAAAPAPPAPVLPLVVPDASVAAKDKEPVAVPDATAALAPPVPDAGPAVAVAASPPPPAPEPEPPPVKRRRNSEATRAEMFHAVALSQVKRGEAALERNRIDEALASFKAAIENENSIAIAWRGMGMAYAMQGKDAQALQSYERYLQLAPGAPDAKDIRASIAELKSRSKIGAGEEK
jgi:tetratricopeptide (TPR) repeat protein